MAPEYAREIVRWPSTSKQLLVPEGILGQRRTREALHSLSVQYQYLDIELCPCVHLFH
jgi:hypothetical protein